MYITDKEWKQINRLESTATTAFVMLNVFLSVSLSLCSSTYLFGKRTWWSPYVISITMLFAIVFLAINIVCRHKKEDIFIQIRERDDVDVTTWVMNDQAAMPAEDNTSN